MHDQAPEVSLRGHQDDGPILATAYTTNSFDYNSPYQQQQDKTHTGFTPIQQHPFLPQYAQSMQHPTPPSLPASAEQQQQQQEQVDPPTPQAKRKGKWIWPLALVIAILAALAAGIGIGYAVGDNKSSSSPKGNSTDGSSSSSPVTTGNTGITAYTCSPSSTYASPFGTSFAQECNVSYKTNQTAYDNSSVIVKNFAGLTVYNLETCLDECAKRNQQLRIGNMLGDECLAVSFYANLTYSIPAWAGNCFLKNAKGIGRNWDENSNASLTASGYMVSLS